MFSPPMKGLIAATMTPFGDDGSLDLNAIDAMIDRLINSGVAGLYVCGSTGEGMSMTCAERKAVVEASVRAAGGRVPVIVQVGHNALAAARDLAVHAVATGANAVSATCPSYFKVGNAQTLVQCMREVASGAEHLPFYYYHIPALTGSPIDIVDFLRRGGDQIANLVGIKYTDTRLHEFQSCLNVDDGRFDIVWGCDEMLLGAWATGARAAIGSSYNIAAPLYQSIINALESGDSVTARRLQFQSVAMIEVMKRFAYHGALKQIMDMLGTPVGSCRLPLTGLSKQETKLLREQLDSIGFFDWCGHAAIADRHRS